MNCTIQYYMLCFRAFLPPCPLEILLSWHTCMIYTNIKLNQNHSNLGISLSVYVSSVTWPAAGHLDPVASACQPSAGTPRCLPLMVSLEGRFFRHPQPRSPGHFCRGRHLCPRLAPELSLHSLWLLVFCRHPRRSSPARCASTANPHGQSWVWSFLLTSCHATDDCHSWIQHGLPCLLSPSPSGLLQWGAMMPLWTSGVAYITCRTQFLYTLLLQLLDAIL